MDKQREHTNKQTARETEINGYSEREKGTERVKVCLEVIFQTDKQTERWRDGEI